MSITIFLPISDGWWPGEYNDLPEPSSSKPKPEVEFEKNSSKLESKEQLDFKKPLAMVRFFDDDKFDTVRVYDNEIVKPYSCDEKKEFVERGLAKFSAENQPKGSMFDFRARQAQFYKDVEMAEVMTDNNPEIADILAQYEVIDDPEELAKPPPKKKGRKRKRN